MTYVITEQCVDVMDQRCVRECPVDCIYQGGRSMYINPDECIECGACEWVCPVNAISLDVDLPEDKAELTDLTREWVTEHSVVGGAGKRGVVGIDRPDVAALPAKPPAD